MDAFSASGLMTALVIALVLFGTLWGAAKAGLSV